LHARRHAIPPSDVASVNEEIISVQYKKRQYKKDYPSKRPPGTDRSGMGRTSPGDRPLIGGSCRLSKGRVDIGDPVKSIPKPGAERAIVDETVHNVGVIAPANETDAGSNFRLGMLTAEGSHGPSNRQSMDRPAGAGPGGRDEVAGHDRTGRR
jgi:hypothetical protein